MEQSEYILKTVYKQYIVSKLLEIYSLDLKDQLPNKYIAAKNEELIKAARKFYSAFDRKINLDGVETIDMMSGEYFSAWDALLSLDSENFVYISEQIKALLKQQKEIEFDEHFGSNLLNPEFQKQIV